MALISAFGIVQSQTHFVPSWTGNGVDHMNIYVLEATIDGVAMQVGDEIGIFDGDQCVGAGILTEVLGGGAYLSIIVSKDDEETTSADGFTPGNEISFRLWDHADSKEITHLTSSYTSGDGLFAIGGTAAIQLSGIKTVSGSIDLLNGWNIFSLPCIPEDIQMISIVQPLIDAGSLVKVQDEAGNAIEYVVPIGLVNNIGDWAGTEGYKIRVNADTQLDFSGGPNDEPFLIPLTENWNIISYPFMNPQDAGDALDGLVTASLLSKVQDEAGNAIEEVIPIGWVDNIGDFETGEGYKIKVSADCDLSFYLPAGTIAKYAPKSDMNTGSFFTPSFKGHGLDHMNLYVLRSLESTFEINDGDEIAAFDGDICVGTRTVTSSMSEFISMALSMDDPTTPIQDGYREGNLISLKIKKQGDHTLYQPGLLFPGENQGEFERMGTAVVALNSTTGIEGMNMQSDQFLVSSPNPFSNEVRISYQMVQAGKAELSIYDMSGRIVKSLLSEDLNAGSYALTWDGRDDKGNELPAGNYICQFRNSSGTHSQLISCQK